MSGISNVLNVAFSTFSQLLAHNPWPVYFRLVNNGEAVELWAGVDTQVYASWATGGDLTAFNELPNEKVEVPSQDDAIALIIGIKRMFDERRTDDSRLRVAFEKSDLSKLNIISPNWADRCTWWYDSVKVEDEIATYGSETGRWNLENSYLIDVFHGRISDEVDLESYRVSVSVNGVEKHEQDPHTGEGDFLVNYEEGYLTFDPPISSGSEVKVSYHYENGSKFVIKPAHGKHLLINAVEVQFSDDTEMRDTVVFQPVGYASIFNPEFNPNTDDPFELFPIPNGKSGGGSKVYKTMYDFINESTYSYPRYKAASPGTWRGFDHEIIIVSWDYTTSTRLFSGYGMQINVFLQHDVPMGGQYCTAAFYCTSDDC